MTLSADEFIRRFLLHVLPDGFHRIRHYGLLANGHRVAKLAQCRRFSMPITPRPIPSWRPVTPKAIDRTTPPTFSSAQIAAAPCGGSQPCRDPLPISHSIVIRHDLIAAYDRHCRRACCAKFVAQPDSYADDAAIPTPELVNE